MSRFESEAMRREPTGPRGEVAAAVIPDLAVSVRPIADCVRSSVGWSVGLRNRRSQVRILSGALKLGAESAANGRFPTGRRHSLKFRIAPGIRRWATENHRADHRAAAEARSRLRQTRADHRAAAEARSRLRQTRADHRAAAEARSRLRHASRITPSPWTRIRGESLGGYGERRPPRLPLRPEGRP
jgi:hypothetical protein